jgi:hypothetical protein
MQKMSVPLSIHWQCPKLENRIRQHYHNGVLPGEEGKGKRGPFFLHCRCYNGYEVLLTHVDTF